jgi:glycine cleavage system H protein
VSKWSKKNEALMKFSKSHEWVKVKGSTAFIGISKEALGLLGEIVFVDLPNVGKVIKKEEPVALLEASKAASDIYSPLSGKIIAVNESLREKPALINQSPEKDGWLFQIEISHPEELDLLMDEKEYRAFAGG